MKRAFFSFVLICVTAFGLFAQDDEILMTIDGQPVTKAEFEYIYKKNNNNVFSEADKKSPEDYLDLFIDFKLKVIEAENLKMDTSQAFINELAGYRKEVAAPYLTDTNFDEQLVKETYKRMTKEVDASHILLRIDQNATPDQEAKVLERITNIREEIVNGKDFGEAAVEYSEDPSAKDNKGHLGYFTAFMMVAPFEDAAFETPVGEVSEPVRTRFGYHIIKVNDVRKNKGEILVAHIMKNVASDASEETRKAQKEKIDAIYEELLKGADFAEMAKKESDDRRTATEGGKMPWFAAGRIIPEFSNPAFAIENIGDFTKPVETAFGYHIIKKLDEKPVASFEDMKAEIETRIKRDPERSNSSQHAFIASLKDEYGYSENEANKKVLAEKTILDSASVSKLVLFSIDGKDYTGADFTSWIANNKQQNPIYSTQFDQWVDAEVLALEDAKLEIKHPEFKFLMKEYHDGILLFNISQEKIWNYASQDSAGLEAFYEKNKGTHMWNERFKGSIISCEDPAVHEQADNLFGAGLSNDEVMEHINVDGELIKFKTGAWEEGENPIVDYFVWNGPKPADFNEEVTFVRGDKVGPEPKELDEARGLYISDYQKYLEEKWIKELRSKYKVKINKKVLKTVPGV
ncbi:peptidylprolyl isomerase [Maribellus sediminis]|uniref:peptidylprolyl isomerase n=1 Tax=Maribellus sediminis TaxID=2696285 RepID=UPI00142FE2E0|nr:peptidylprolyl isomerase [Maribellus sediminis]